MLSRIVLRLLDGRRVLIGLAAVLVGSAAVVADSNDPCAGKEVNGPLDLSGAKICYEECGAGPAIVLLHDGLLHSVSWDEVWQPLAKKYHVIRYDRRGFGRAEPPASSFSFSEKLTQLIK